MNARMDRPATDAVRAIQAALRAQGAVADPMAVVQAHIAAVRCGDAGLMAADYGDAARITRGADVVVPRDYFPLALQRLGPSELVVHSLTTGTSTDPGQAGTRIVLQWELRGGKADGTRGTDTFTVRGDRIVDQQVVLHTADY